MRAAGWVTVIVALMAAAFSIQPASAAINARTGTAQAASTAGWGLVPTGSTGSLVAVGPVTGTQYVTLQSTGAALDARFTEVVEVRATSVLSVGQVLLQACSGAWNAAGGCDGTTTTLDSTLTPAVPVHLEVPAGGQVRLQVVPLHLSAMTSVSVSASVRN